MHVVGNERADPRRGKGQGRGNRRGPSDHRIKNSNVKKGIRKKNDGFFPEGKAQQDRAEREGNDQRADGETIGDVLQGQERVQAPKQSGLKTKHSPPHQISK